MLFLINIQLLPYQNLFETGAKIHEIDVKNYMKSLTMYHTSVAQLDQSIYKHFVINQNTISKSNPGGNNHNAKIMGLF